MDCHTYVRVGLFVKIETEIASEAETMWSKVSRVYTLVSSGPTVVASIQEMYGHILDVNLIQ